MGRRQLLRRLGVKPHIGRLFAADDDLPGDGRHVVVLQYDFWQVRYDGRQDVLGSTIRLNGTPFTVVGVAAPNFEGTNPGCSLSCGRRSTPGPH
jgi:putative ABC transport system permease protein